MIPNRQELLSLWFALPWVVEVSSAEAIGLLEDRRLWGLGLGWIDIHLLGSALVSQARLWTRDHPLRHAAGQLRISLVT
jgi:hypothetical protein